MQSVLDRIAPARCSGAYPSRPAIAALRAVARLRSGPFNSESNIGTNLSKELRHEQGTSTGWYTQGRIHPDG